MNNPAIEAPEKYNSLREIPPKELAGRVVHSLILAEGNLNKYALIIEKLLEEIHKEYAALTPAPAVDAHKQAIAEAEERLNELPEAQRKAIVGYAAVDVPADEFHDVSPLEIDTCPQCNGCGFEIPQANERQCGHCFGTGYVGDINVVEMKDIPVNAAKNIADHYGYDQLIIVGRRIGEDGGEHVTTYGRNKAHCDVAAKCGDFLKYKIMGWHDAPPAPIPGLEEAIKGTERDIKNGILSMNPLIGALLEAGKRELKRETQRNG